MEVAQYFDGINEIIKSGGPEPSDYEFLTKTCDRIMREDLSLVEEHKLYSKIESLLNVNSMIGFSFRKPNGYAGDYELIDRIYQKWKSSDDETYHKWDDYFHDLNAAKAVRNRKDYLIKQLVELNSRIEDPKVLNLGSGPCSDIYQYFLKIPKSNIQFDCLDMDQNAIDYASAVCDNYIKSINFINKNAFRYRSEYKYDLIWSAGLFDYFSDKLFVRLLNRMYCLLHDKGKLMIGNFSDDNPSRGVMEVFGQWYLHHRSKDQLIELAIKAGVSREKIEIYSENTGVNLFLHVEK